MKGIFVAGTDTDVGKTFVSALLIQALKAEKVDPYYYKPVASGGPVDLDTVKEFGELDENRSCCPIIFDTPCSPHFASELEHRVISKDEIMKTCKSIVQSESYTLIEGAGGVIVPIMRDGFDLYELIKEVNLPVVLVTKTGVGTINHTLLTLEFLKLKEIKVAGIVFNGYEGGTFEDDNIALIRKRVDIPVLGIIPKLMSEPNVCKMKQLAKDNLSEQMHYLL